MAYRPPRFKEGNRIAAKLTPERHRLVIDSILRGEWLATAAGHAGVHASTIRNWVAAGERPDALPEERAFAEEYWSANAAAESKVIMQACPPGDAKAAQWFAERRWPKHWSAKSKVELTGKNGTPLHPEAQVLDVDLLSIEQLQALEGIYQNVLTAPARSIVEGQATPTERNADPEPARGSESSTAQGVAGPVP